MDLWDARLNQALRKRRSVAEYGPMPQSENGSHRRGKPSDFAGSPFLGNVQSSCNIESIIFRNRHPSDFDSCFASLKRCWTCVLRRTNDEGSYLFLPIEFVSYH